MNLPLRIEILPAAFLDDELCAGIVELCEQAYEEPLAGTIATFEGPTHVLGFLGDELVSHALWVPRELRHGSLPLRAAYVEAVATRPHLQGRGYASAVLRALAGHITGFDIGALSPSDAKYYERLGWELWRGPLFLRTEHGDEPTPDEEVMILRLPGTPPLDTGGPLAAAWRPGDIW
jgi:aminoglycoside 2'-N-acetyltransferase I